MVESWLRLSPRDPVTPGALFIPQAGGKWIFNAIRATDSVQCYCPRHEVWEEDPSTHFPDPIYYLDDIATINLITGWKSAEFPTPCGRSYYVMEEADSPHSFWKIGPYATGDCWLGLFWENRIFLKG